MKPAFDHQVTLTRDLRVGEYIASGRVSRKRIKAGATVRVTYNPRATNAMVTFRDRTFSAVPAAVEDATGLDLRAATSSLCGSCNGHGEVEYRHRPAEVCGRCLGDGVYTR